MIKKCIIFLVLFLLVGCVNVDTTNEHEGMNHEETNAAPSTTEFLKAFDTMHAGMNIDYSGDADIDFVRGMIAHHQGAIDMARVVIEHGSDPEIMALAENIIEAQEAEIAFMEEWLKDHD